MSGVLVLAEQAGGELGEQTLELIGAGLELAEGGAGVSAVSVALLGAGGASLVEEVSASGVSEVILAGLTLERFEAHVWELALSELIEARRPAVVLLAHSGDSLGYAAAVAARLGLGFAGDVRGICWEQDTLVVSRDADGGRLRAELDFPGKETVLLTLRRGAFPVCDVGAGATVEVSEPQINGLEQAGRTERIELVPRSAGAVDIAKADFLLSIGRGVVGEDERISELEELAKSLGATLSGSAPLVEAGKLPRSRKVGQSGARVAPRVYLALGISGAAPHVAGMSNARMIIAVNSDPEARIFEVAHYGAVADLFEVAQALERELT
jgi:electron transfer flavoprotein alpha subunit